MKSLLFLSLLLMTFNIAMADCLACWELRKVEITYNDGTILNGYVEWNEGWISSALDYKVWSNKFPESFVKLYTTLKPQYDVNIYQKIFPIKNDSIGEFVSRLKEYIIKIDFQQINSIREIEVTTKKFEGADDIPIFTLAEIQKLKTNPIALISIDEEVAVIYFLSYNPAITRKQLNTINKKNFEQKAEILKDQGVIIFTIGYD